GVLVFAHPEPAHEDRTALAPVLRPLDPTLGRIEDHRAPGGGDAGAVTRREDQLLAEVVLAALHRVGALAAGSEERVSVRKVPETLRAIILNCEVRDRFARNRRKANVDAGDAGLVQRVLDQFADQPALAVLLGLPAQA